MEIVARWRENADQPLEPLVVERVGRTAVIPEHHPVIVSHGRCGKRQAARVWAEQEVDFVVLYQSPCSIRGSGRLTLVIVLDQLERQLLTVSDRDPPTDRSSSGSSG